MSAAPPLERAQRPPHISVVIPCRNEERAIAACLRSVLAFELPGLEMEVIVADGMSADRTRDIVDEFARRDPRLRLIANPSGSTPAGLNAAIRQARGEYVARVDAHTEYAPDYLRECLSVFLQSGAENVGGPARTRSASYIQRSIAAAYHSRFAVGNAAFHQPRYEGPVDTVPYGFWKRTRVLELGLFDEELARNQDDELNLRLIRAGGRIWQSPRIRSWYLPRASLTALFRQYARYGYWKVRVIQKHGAPASWRHLVPASFVASLLLLLLLSPVAGAARHAAALLLGVYSAALVTASAIVSARAGLALLPALPPVFVCYHFGYGLGFLAGMWHFLIRRNLARRYVGAERR
jgi:glycosyltransferase involved in cell wall biosynthesis